MEAEHLIKKYGVRQALDNLSKQFPYSGLLKKLWTKEQLEAYRLYNNVKDLCIHEKVETICTDFHRREWGQVCEDCGKYLSKGWLEPTDILVINDE